MTREETKKRFESWCQAHIGNDASDEDCHMFNNIMALLEQEPCEDCVSRKGVHDMLENIPVTFESKWFNWLQMACNRLAELPPVVPQPKTGYWISWYEIIEEEWGTEHNPHCKCSECNTEVDPHTSKFINCCPVCGAKMIGYKKREVQV